MKEQNKGITLVALVITIIILLILVGITISSLTNSGLLVKSQETTRISEIKKIEEEARISYMERQIEEVTGGEQATMAGVISDLRKKRYKIKEVTDGIDNVIGIKLSKSEISMGKNSTEEIAYEYEYASGTTVRYFVEVQGKYYEILYNNGIITIKTNEEDLEKIDIKATIKIESDNENIVIAELIENNRILLKTRQQVGNAKITVRYENIETFCDVMIKIPITSLKLSGPTEVLVGTKYGLTLECDPEDTTDECIWKLGDEDLSKDFDSSNIIDNIVGARKFSVHSGNFYDEHTVFIRPYSGELNNIPDTEKIELEETFSIQTPENVNNLENTSELKLPSLKLSLDMKQYGAGNSREGGIVWDLMKYQGGVEACKFHKVKFDWRAYGRPHSDTSVILRALNAESQVIHEWTIRNFSSSTTSNTVNATNAIYEWDEDEKITQLRFILRHKINKTYVSNCPFRLQISNLFIE